MSNVRLGVQEFVEWLEDGGSQLRGLWVVASETGARRVVGE